MFPAVFLDRDGVIIENRANYVRAWEDVEIFPQALAALARLKNSPFKIVIITNQAGIGHGLIRLQAAAEINRRLIEEIERAGGRIDGLYLCPHRPDEGCSCRKPKPGMILQAAEELDIDLQRSILIGDALTDLQAGIAAGVGQVALVRTGRGAEQEQAAEQMFPFPVFDTLSQAVNALIFDR